MNRVVLLRSNPVSPDPPVEKMANALLTSGYSVTIVAWDREGNYYQKDEILKQQNGTMRIVKFGIPAVYSGGLRKTLKQFIQFQIRLGKWLADNDNSYDIIHAFDFDTGFIAYKLAKKRKKIFVYHILDYYIDSHGFAGTGIGNIVKRSEDKLIHNADAAIICTEKRIEQICDANPKKLVIIHNTPQQILEETAALKEEQTHKRVKIVYVGILTESRFIRETAKLVAADDRLEFHIGGFGYLEEELRFIANQNENIYFYGKLSYDKTLSLEKSCDLMIAIYDPGIPNHRYAAPNKFYESLMLGKPVIMARNTGFDEIIEQNNIGCLIEYSNEGLKTGVEKLLKQRELWQEMSQRGKKLYKENYSWTIMEKRITKLYQDLIVEYKVKGKIEV